jgi:phage host-nuclease inhibitor protein Gam
MAKALVGYLGGPTSAQHQQVASMRRRITDLENEVLRLKVENDGLLAALRERVDQVSASDLAQPVSH